MYKTKLTNNLFRSFSHELMTPLNSIVSSSDALQIIFKENQHLMENFFQPIHFSSKILINWFSDILDYGMIQNNQFKINRNIIDLKKMVLEVISVFQISA